MRNEVAVLSQSARQAASSLSPGGFQLLGYDSKTKGGTSLKAGPGPVRKREHLVAHPVGGALAGGSGPWVNAPSHLTTSAGARGKHAHTSCSPY
jgi:hypothetical protein